MVGGIEQLPTSYPTFVFDSCLGWLVAERDSRYLGRIGADGCSLRGLSECFDERLDDLRDMLVCRGSESTKVISPIPASRLISAIERRSWRVISGGKWTERVLVL